MRRLKTPYEYRQTRHFTPDDVVARVWSLVKERRRHIGSVIDLGAGDGRFGMFGNYDQYFGIEIDKETPRCSLPDHGKIEYGCAFDLATSTNKSWDLVIGNPPYIRHHYIELDWMEKIALRFKASLGIELNRQANLFVYFMLLGLEISSEDGMVAMVVPYEWISRPSAAPLRELIESNNWNVAIYRFSYPVFKKVDTTACIAIIDKQGEAKWDYWEIGKNRIIKRARSTGSRYNVLEYSNAGDVSAKRGLSPGTQKVFTLTEGERIHNGLSKNDVYPCVTSLRQLPKHVESLTQSSFNKYFRDQGLKCWLIKSDLETLSASLQAYLNHIAEEDRNTATCLRQNPWYRFNVFPVPQVLIASAFTEFGPKVVKNVLGVRQVGAVYGVYCKPKQIPQLSKFLRNYNFEKRVIAHSGKLKKIEVRQLNTVLSEASV